MPSVEDETGCIARKAKSDSPLESTRKRSNTRQSYSVDETFNLNKEKSIEIIEVSTTNPHVASTTANQGSVVTRQKQQKPTFVFKKTQKIYEIPTESKKENKPEVIMPPFALKHQLIALPITFDRPLQHARNVYNLMIKSVKLDCLSLNQFLSITVVQLETKLVCAQSKVINLVPTSWRDSCVYDPLRLKQNLENLKISQFLVSKKIEPVINALGLVNIGNNECVPVYDGNMADFFPDRVELTRESYVSYIKAMIQLSRFNDTTRVDIDSGFGRESQAVQTKLRPSNRQLLAWSQLPVSQEAFDESWIGFGEARTSGKIWPQPSFLRTYDDGDALTSAEINLEGCTNTLISSMIPNCDKLENKSEVSDLPSPLNSSNQPKLNQMSSQNAVVVINLQPGPENTIQALPSEIVLNSSEKNEQQQSGLLQEIASKLFINGNKKLVTPSQSFESNKTTPIGSQLICLQPGHKPVLVQSTKSEPATYCSDAPIVYFDLETTGLAYDHEIVQISCVSSIANSFSSEFNVYTLPHRKFQSMASQITGLTRRGNNVCLRGKKMPTVSLPQGLQELVEWLKKFPKPPLLIAHNAKKFDCPRLVLALWNANLFMQFASVCGGFCDSLEALRKYLPKRPDYKLQNLLLEFCSELTSDNMAHNALDDSRAIENVFMKVLAPRIGVTNEEFKSNPTFLHEALSPFVFSVETALNQLKKSPAGSQRIRSSGS